MQTGKARGKVKKGWLVSLDSWVSNSIHCHLFLCLVHAGGLTGVPVSKPEWFSTRTHLVLGKYAHAYKVCHVDWLYSLEIQVLSYTCGLRGNRKVPCSPNLSLVDILH